MQKLHAKGVQGTQAFPCVVGNGLGSVQAMTRGPCRTHRQPGRPVHVVSAACRVGLPRHLGSIQQRQRRPQAETVVAVHVRDEDAA